MFKKNVINIAKIQAFTLLELLVSLCVLTILISIAIPAMQNFSADKRAIAQINSLGHALYYARSEAVLRAEKIILCASADGRSCGGKWRDGQMVSTTGGEVLRLFSALPARDELIWNSSAGKDALVEWLPSGYTNGQRGTFYYCAIAAAYSRILVLLDTGRWYVAAMTLSDFEKFCPKSAALQYF